MQTDISHTNLRHASLQKHTTGRGADLLTASCPYFLGSSLTSRPLTGLQALVPVGGLPPLTTQLAANGFAGYSKLKPKEVGYLLNHSEQVRVCFVTCIAPSPCITGEGSQSRATGFTFGGVG